MNIDITWLTDSSVCETCGTSYAEGAVVMIDGKEIEELDLKPTAHCFSGSDYSESDVYKRILNYLGHELEESYH